MIPTLLILFAVGQAVHAFRATAGIWATEDDAVRARQIRFSAGFTAVILIVTAWLVYRMEWL